ncbi:MAG: hypothetical protein RIT38_930, partial [Bacteroidota bacterium]
MGDKFIDSSSVNNLECTINLKPNGISNEKLD